MANEENIPRAPNEQERREIAQAAREAMGLTEEEQPDGMSGFCAIFDHYSTDCPGFQGKVAVVVWSGSPNFIDSLTYNNQAKKWELQKKD